MIEQVQRLRLAELCQSAPDTAHALGNPLLVLDQSEANVLVAAGAEAGAGTDRHRRLLHQLDRELERAEAAVGLRDLRPDEHRAARLLDLPADPVEPVAKHVAARLVDGAEPVSYTHMTL